MDIRFQALITWDRALIIRRDDEPATVQDRLDVYHRQTEPVKAFYAARGKLYRVEGQEQVEDTSALVLKALEAGGISEE